MGVQSSRGLKKVREGIVTSDAMDKTRVVRVHRRVQHPLYKKVVTKFKTFYVHDEKNETRVGDRVRIVESRPLSRLKRWRLVNVLRKAN